MDIDRSVFQIPMVGQKKAPVFETADKTSEIYQELNAINEEIEACRLRNS